MAERGSLQALARHAGQRAEPRARVRQVFLRRVLFVATRLPAGNRRRRHSHGDDGLGVAQQRVGIADVPRARRLSARSVWRRVRALGEHAQGRTAGRAPSVAMPPSNGCMSVMISR